MTAAEFVCWIAGQYDPDPPAEAQRLARAWIDKARLIRDGGEEINSPTKFGYFTYFTARWKNVKDEKPLIDEEVLVYSPALGFLIVRRFEDGWKEIWDNCDIYTEVTHWMELPPRPNTS